MKKNLADTLAPDERKHLAGKVCEWFKQSQEGRTEWEEKRKSWFELWLCKPDEGRRLPWPDASNVCLPLASSAINQWHGRTVSSILDAPFICRVLPIGAEDATKAKDAEYFLNWQLIHDVDGYEDELDRLILKLAIDGTAFLKTQWDHKEDKPIIEYVSALDVFLPYKTRKLKQARYIIHRVKRAKELIEEYISSGEYSDKDFDFEKLEAPTAEPEDQFSIVQGTAEEFHGEAPPPGHKYDFTILECHFTGIIPSISDKRQPYTVWVLKEAQAVLKVVRRSYKGEEVSVFQDFHFIPNPEGYYSYGFCHFIEPLNKSANTIFNQIFDSGRITNNPFFFYGRRAGLKRRRLALEPGIGYEIEDAQQVMFPNIQRLDGSLPMILGMIDRYMQLFTSTSEQLQGRQQKGVREPTVGATNALIEQGLVTLGVLAKRVYRAHRQHLRQVVSLNAIFLKDDKPFRVVGTTTSQPFRQINRNHFTGKFDIIPTADPTWANKAQRRAEATELMMVALQHPLIARPSETGEVANPVAALAFTREWLESYDRRDLMKYMPPPEEPMIPPEMENAVFLQGETVEPKPNEDHMVHVETHLFFLNTPIGKAMTEAKKKALRDHVAQHNALASLEMQADSVGLPPQQGLLGDALDEVNEREARQNGQGPQRKGIASQPSIGIQTGVPRV